MGQKSFSENFFSSSVYKILLGTDIKKQYLILGLLCCVTLAYLIQNNWRILQFVYSAPAIVFLAYWWIAPESGTSLFTQLLPLYSWHTGG